MQFVVNSIIERLSEDLEVVEILRILWIDGEQKNAVVVNIDDHRKMSYPYVVRCEEIMFEVYEKKSRLSDLETDMQLLSPNEEYLEKYKENRDRRWNLIKDIVQEEPAIYDSKSRGKLIEELHTASGKSKKVIRDYLLTQLSQSEN